MIDQNDYSEYFFGGSDNYNQDTSNNGYNNQYEATYEPESQGNSYNSNSWQSNNQEGCYNSNNGAFDSENYNTQTQAYQDSDYSNFDFDAHQPVQLSYGNENNFSWGQNYSSMANVSQNYTSENNGYGNQGAPAAYPTNSMNDLVEKNYGESQSTNGFEFNASSNRTAIGTDSKLLNLANQSSDKAASNANGVKNYITITSKTFAKFMLEPSNQEINRIINESIQQQCPADFFAARNAVMQFITEKISGKKIHRNGSKQYKITARKDIEAVFFPQKKDTSDEVAIKVILRAMMQRFLRSQTFQDWINTEYEAKSSGGKEFYLDHKNLEQIVGVYVDQDFKPRFN